MYIKSPIVNILGFVGRIVSGESVCRQSTVYCDKPLPYTVARISHEMGHNKRVELCSSKPLMSTEIYISSTLKGYPTLLIAIIYKHFKCKYQVFLAYQLQTDG